MSALFQKDFLLGAATAAHQVEGNNFYNDTWVEEQLPHSTYDEPSLAAVDHYHRYEEDIRLLKEAGLNAYRFSIEWSRIQPEPDVWVEEEVEHYRQVLLYCRQLGVTPVVTMFHFTSPKWLITMGGWENPEVVTYFANYCRRLAKELGNLVEYVCTMNEANMRMQIAEILKEMGRQPVESGQDDSKTDIQVGINLEADRMALAEREAREAFGIPEGKGVHTFVSPCTPEGDRIVMRAHEAARDAMKAECPWLKIGISLTVHDLQALPGGEAAVQEEWENEFLHYLPCFEKDDFLGVQCYTRRCYDADGARKPEAGAPLTQMNYEDYPLAAANAVRRVSESFHGDIYVTENGIATADDGRRSEFIREAADGLMECIADGIPLKGYFYWSLLDNFEWQKGYSMTFGLIGVDRKTQTRYPKESLRVLGSLR